MSGETVITIDPVYGAPGVAPLYRGRCMIHLAFTTSPVSWNDCVRELWVHVSRDHPDWAARVRSSLRVGGIVL